MITETLDRLLDPYQLLVLGITLHAVQTHLKFFKTEHPIAGNFQIFEEIKHLSLIEV